MLKEVDISTALLNYIKSKSVYIMKPTNDKDNGVQYEVCNLSDILKGCKFLLDENNTSLDIGETTVTSNEPRTIESTVSIPDNEATSASNIEDSEPYTFPQCPKELIEKYTKPKSEKPKTHGRKRTVDVGKIHALKEAGWSKKDVADDMHVCLATVHRYWNTESEE